MSVGWGGGVEEIVEWMLLSCSTLSEVINIDIFSADSLTPANVIQIAKS